MIVNELLSYACFYLNNSSLDNIKRLMLNFYTHDEIIDSKKLLWNLSSSELNSYIERKSSENRTCDDANLNDIFEALVKLDLTQNLPDFVAKDFSRIPERSPEELNLTYILDRISRLEKAVRISDNIVATHANSISKFENNDFDSKFSKLENKIQEHGVALADLTARSKFNFADNDKSLQSLPIGRNYDFKAINDNSVAGSVDNDSDWISIVDQFDVPDVTKNKNYNDATLRFLNLYDKKSIKQRKRKITTKSKKNSNFDANIKCDTHICDQGLKGAPNQKGVLYLGRVSQGSRDQVFDYMHSNGEDVHDVSLVSNLNARFKSFKIIVSRDECSKLLDKYFWPEGVIVKPWRNYNNPHKSKEYFNSMYRPVPARNN